MAQLYCPIDDPTGERMGITLYQSPPQLADEPERQEAIEALGPIALSGDPALRGIVDEVRRTVRTAMAAVTVIYRDWQYVIAGSGLPEGPSTRRTSFCGHTVAQAEGVVCVLDATADKRFAGNPDVDGGLGIRFYAGAPLAVVPGVAIGAVCVFDPHPRIALSEMDQRRLTGAAAAAMAVIEARAAAARHG